LKREILFIFNVLFTLSGEQKLILHGTEIKTGTPTKSMTGVYYFYYAPSSEGKFVIKFSGIINSQTVIGRNVFEIKETNTN